MKTGIQVKSELLKYKNDANCPPPYRGAMEDAYRYILSLEKHNDDLIENMFGQQLTGTTDIEHGDDPEIGPKSLGVLTGYKHNDIGDGFDLFQVSTMGHSYTFDIRQYAGSHKRVFKTVHNMNHYMGEAIKKITLIDDTGYEKDLFGRTDMHFDQEHISIVRIKLLSTSQILDFYVTDAVTGKSDFAYVMAHQDGRLL
ncbi:MAG: hypothetical protein NC218_01855 [Acetobacter sp.]|nr:hypothetical protein [Acetobacter sp.]